MLITSINFRGNHHKFLEGGGTASKYLPTYNLHAAGMSCNHFDDIWYVVRWSCQPPWQPDGMLLERYHWMLIVTAMCGIGEGGDVFCKHLHQLDTSGHAPPDKVIIEVAPLKAIATYYKGAGTIDRHNRTTSMSCG